MKREGKHILETIEKYAQPPFDYLTDDMTVPFALALVEKDREIERLTTENAELRLARCEFDKCDRMRAALIQVGCFVAAMTENNWRDVALHIERQADVVWPQTEKKP